ncbi:MAG: sulfite exporter TauE/SafE family protein [Opitutaceae bacterium]|nr:sulfite exporter TauE/SafE family protein [Cytophagales bacterium]
MELAGYLLAILVGFTMGLIGGGGSILTVPILVYLFGMDTLLASSYSLFVVGSTSAIGVLSHYRQGNIRFKNALFFGLPSIIGVFVTRKYLVTLIPSVIFSAGDFVMTKSILLLILFALLMITASYYMIRKSDAKDINLNTGIHKETLVLLGFIIGSLTGLLGAGGGFMIVPVLIYCSYTMKQAVGTSLFIMALSAFIGFLGDVYLGVKIDYFFLLKFSGIAAIGILIGTSLSNYITPTKLKPAFGVFILISGLYILIKETLFY